MANRSWIILLITLLLAASTAWGAPAPGAGAVHKDRSSLPITVTADQLKADNKGKQAVFTGRVVARQDDVTIYCDRLEVYYGPSGDQVDKIVANGTVRIVQADRIGTGGHAVYESKPGRITLTGTPRVTQGADSITGTVITYYLDEDRSEVQGGANARVEAVIHPRAGSIKPRK